MLLKKKEKNLSDIFLFKFKEYIKNLNTKIQNSNLNLSIKYSLISDAKYIRPLLCYLSYRLFAKKDCWKKILPLTTAIELFHTFTLTHDDIMDNAPLRRGKESVYKKWGVNNAILTGDAILILAYNELNKMNHHLNLTKAIDILKNFNKCALKVCEGQQMDMDFEKKIIVDEKDYLRMIELKTAWLFAFAMKMGSYLSVDNTYLINNIFKTGLLLGKVFQIQDDLLDTYGDDKTGKKTGADILSSKKNYPFVLAIAKSDEKLKKELLNIYSLKYANDKVEKVLKIYNKLNIKEEILDKINNYFNNILQLIDSIDNCNFEFKQEIIYLIKRMKKREK